MANKNEAWSRLESVIRWANMTTNYFGRHIGLLRSENLYQIKAGKNGISQNLAKRIVDKFPEISAGWLLTGEGDMFNSGEPSGNIPFVDGDAVGRGLLGCDDIPASFTMNIPLIESCDCALRTYDHAMSPEIMAGAIVFLKRNDAEAIIPGGIYVIVSPKYIILRRVRLSEVTDGTDTVPTLVLEADNPSYDSITVRIDEITCIYRVVANLKLY